MTHEDNVCICLSSDRTGAYIHKLSVTLPSRDLVSAPSDVGTMHLARCHMCPIAPELMTGCC